jgi:dihydrofolate reductase
MGRTVVMLSLSLDGFFQGPDRDLSWHRVDEEVHGEFNAVLAAAGAFLSGRVTHELMAEVWPTADADPDATPTMAEFAGIWRDKPKVVYSRTLQQAGWNTTIVRDVVAEDVRALKAATDGDLAVGGAGLAESFRRLGLIDEYRLYVNPVVLGAGTPLFPPGERVDLRLLETRPFANGVVLARYAPVRPAGG